MLQVVLVYFETIGKYLEGNTGRESAASFKKGFLSVFPQVAEFPYSVTREFLDTLYSGARCGLYHASMTAPGIALSRTGTPIQFTQTPVQIVIDPHALIPAMKDHFTDYIQKLKNEENKELRGNFRKCFDHSRKPS